MRHRVSLSSTTPCLSVTDFHETLLTLRLGLQLTNLPGNITGRVSQTRWQSGEVNVRESTARPIINSASSLVLTLARRPPIRSCRRQKPRTRKYSTIRYSFVRVISSVRAPLRPYEGRRPSPSVTSFCNGDLATTSLCAPTSFSSFFARLSSFKLAYLKDTGTGKYGSTSFTGSPSALRVSSGLMMLTLRSRDATAPRRRVRRGFSYNRLWQQIRHSVCVRCA